jgi:hypothetical protein
MVRSALIVSPAPSHSAAKAILRERSFSARWFG